MIYSIILESYKQVLISVKAINVNNGYIPNHHQMIAFSKQWLRMIRRKTKKNKKEQKQKTNS
jgi:hypothetical protein